jgi:hypothetical protein
MNYELYLILAGGWLMTDDGITDNRSSIRSKEPG